MVKKDQMRSCEKVQVNGEEMQEVDKFNYLGVRINTDGSIGEEVANRCLRKERFRGRCKEVEREHCILRSKTGVT